MAGEDARPLLRRAVDVARRAGDAELLGDALVGLMMGLLWQEDFAAATSAADDCLAVVSPLALTYAQPIALWGQAHVALARRDLPRAREFAGRILSMTDTEAGRTRRGEPDTFARNGAVQILALIAVYEGETRRARDLVRDELAHRTPHPAVFGTCVLLQARGYAELADGDHDEARATAALLHERQRDGCAALTWRAHDIGMRAALAEGDTDAARVHAAELGAFAEATGNAAAKALHLIGLAQADLAAADPGSAEIHAREAFEVAHEAQRPLAAAPALETLAEVCVARGRFAHAARLLAAAEAIAGRRVGALTVRTRAAVRAAVAGELDAAARASAEAEGAAMDMADVAAYIRRTRGRRVRADRGWASLTTSEAMVARLAADGLLNPAIAERLVVARGTVKVHLSRVYAKLGVANRTELAAYIRDVNPA
jgi:DNA-binding NarL/FixJ family response regulator